MKDKNQCDQCIHLGEDLNLCDICDEGVFFKRKIPITNADTIRTMDDEELAGMFYVLQFFQFTQANWLEWLKMEAG